MGARLTTLVFALVLVSAAAESAANTRSPRTSEHARIEATVAERPGYALVQTSDLPKFPRDLKLVGFGFTLTTLSFEMLATGRAHTWINAEPGRRFAYVGGNDPTKDGVNPYQLIRPKDAVSSPSVEPLVLELRDADPSGTWRTTIRFFSLMEEHGVLMVQGYLPASVAAKPIPRELYGRFLPMKVWIKLTAQRARP